MGLSLLILTQTSLNIFYATCDVEFLLFFGSEMKGFDYGLYEELLQEA